MKNVYFTYLDSYQISKHPIKYKEIEEYVYSQIDKLSIIDNSNVLTYFTHGVGDLLITLLADDWCEGTKYIVENIRDIRNRSTIDYIAAVSDPTSWVTPYEIRRLYDYLMSIGTGDVFDHFRKKIKTGDHGRIYLTND